MLPSSSVRRPVMVLMAAVLSSGTLHAAGEISQVTTTDQLGTPFQYTADGTEYAWGAGRNQVIEQFSTAGEGFGFATVADRVELVRRDLDGQASGEPCGVFVETVDGASNTFQANYPVDTTGQENCDMAAMLASRVVNRGALNVFNNVQPQPKNVERVDYLFDNGVLAPIDAAALSQAGHLVAEKSGNNPIRVAAILELDVFGQPARYGDLITVNASTDGCGNDAICYGLTDLQHDYAWLESASLAPQSFPVLIGTSAEPVAMAYVSAAALGLTPGLRYFGYSFFADDVNAADHDLLDVGTFPADTNDADILPGDDADLYGGVSGYFVSENSSTGTVDLFFDENDDGIRDPDEAGIGGVSMTLFADSDGNGVLDPDTDQAVVGTLESGVDGSVILPGLGDGSYFLQLDSTDEDIPGGLSLPDESNPAAFVVSGADPDPIGFAFGDDGAGGGSTAGGDTAGSTTAGAATAGDDTSGGDTAETSTAGDGATDGDAAGTATSGADDAGTSTAGEETAGDDTAGTATSGADDAGTATAGEETAGGDTAGTATSGTDDAGTATAGEDTAGGGTTGVIGDGGELTANRDTFEIRQDTPTALDVLRNDSGGSGAVSIATAAQPPNGTTEVVDGQVVYTPDYGFIGMDTFTYTIADAAGDQATGTVNVEVIRYSDINKDEINDFDQCDCDNLTLETGVDGTGVGSLLPVTLLLLMGLLSWRLWREHRRLSAAVGARR